MNVTLLVKTILRPVKLKRLLDSVRETYPELPIVVYDDGPPKTYLPSAEMQRMNVIYVKQEYDVGIGHCYNTALRCHVSTPYVIICDDDCRFTERTRIETWIPYIEYDVYQLMGGAVRRTKGGNLQLYVGNFEWGPKVHDGWEVRMKAIEVRDLDRPITAQYVMNFFIAQTQFLIDNPWDETLKVCRHEDWFLSANFRGPSIQQNPAPRIGYHPGVEIMHDRDVEPIDESEYLALRSGRFQKHLRMVEEKWELRKGGLKTP